ncbi:MAG: penicillin acylase family protein [Usitatibacteraceae bacterium]
MKKILRISSWFLGIIAIVLLAVALTAYFAMRGSLPQLDGDIKATGFNAPVSAARDSQGTVSITASNTLDAMRAIGYIHAQERFFEMDLARRSAAGELSALLGEATVKMDKDKRQHRLRARMAAQWATLSPQDGEWISVYTQGVNAGLNALGARPWQYLVLQTTPEPWREIDSLLVVSEMYYMLQSRGIEERFSEARLRQQVGDALFDWFKPLGGAWDAPLDGSTIAPAPMPTAALLNVRGAVPTVQNARVAPFAPLEFAEDAAVGSNNWAVGGALSPHGGAILADDMHLGLGVPNIWFRAQFNITEGGSTRRIVGVTLPGLPSIAVGSNGDIAWGYTNGYGQWFDWVAVEPGSALAATVKTTRESIAVKGAPAVDVDVRETAFGPILRNDGKTDYALSWTLYRDGAVNARATSMMFAKTVDEAVTIANTSGIPHQNVLIADKAGNVVWTIMGRMPDYPAGPLKRRGTFTALEGLPTTWLAPEKYPFVKNPPDARLWTANSRQLGGDRAEAGGNLIGDGGFDLGARTGQIRDRLREQKSFDEKKLYAIQLDNESRFLKRWSVMATAAAKAKPSDKTTAIAREIAAWNGRAEKEQTGHRIVRAFRQQVIEQLWKSWLNAAQSARAPTGVMKQDGPEGRFEYAAWAAIEARPEHLLPQPFATWDDFLAAQLTTVYDDLIKQNGSLTEATWGKRNATNLRHPFTRSMPFLSAWLNMPQTPLGGDNHMPMVSAPTFGASQRLVVSPGHEEQGIFVMPGGQSGHPLSPFYGAGHQDWVAGVPGSLLAGEPKHTLRLTP